MKMKITTEAVSPVIGVMLMLVVTIIIAAVVSGFAGDIGLDKKTAPCVTLSEPVFDYDSNVTVGRLVTIHYYYTRNGQEKHVSYSNNGAQNVQLPTTVEDQHGLTFTHMGGEPIDLKDLQMGFNSQNLGMIIDWDSTRANVTETNGEFEPNWKVGDEYKGGCPISRYDVKWWGSDEPAPYTMEELADIVNNAPHYGYFVKISPETPGDTIIRTGDQFKIYTDDGPTGWAIAAYDSDGHYESFGFESGTGCEWRLAHKPSGAMLATGDLTWPDNN